MNQIYDVIIVGGRVAGSHMAARLGKYGFRVLLLERDTLPSLPAVSSPIIYSSTMHLLDEVGADENVYARNTPKLHGVTTFIAGKRISLSVPEYKGRDYGYAIDRARFDGALWDTALGYDLVDGYQNFSVTDLLWDGDTVIGVVGKDQHDDTEKRFMADVVIGADGRFGLVARKTKAEKKDVFDSHPTSTYYAYWQNVAQIDDTPTMSGYEGDGFGYLLMDSADGQTAIVIEGRSDTIQANGDADTFYMERLNDNPLIRERIQHAEMITSVRGMRNIGNSYHQAGGKGWALIGDAYHQKDPLDGQGIYNAVITGKALARELLKWKNGEQSWEKTLREYDDVARVKTYPMYKSLQNQISASFYGSGNNVQIPEWAQENLMRWVLNDDQFTDLMGKMLTREVPPDYITLMTPPTLVGAVARGIRDDIETRIKKRIPFLN